MREIKFRAWFTLKNRMVNHESLSLFYASDEGFTFAFDDSTFVDEEHVEGTLNYELMQFTGLRDKNGKEIYEGDIVDLRDHPFEGPMKINGVYEVGYNERMELCCGSLLLHRVIPYITVIGNIYENPELLQQTG